MSEEFESIHVKAIRSCDVNTTEATNEFKLVQLYINNTDQDVCVIHRNNLPILISKSTAYFGGHGNFVIRTIYHFNSRSQVINTINNLQNIKKTATIKVHELEIVLTALLDAFNSDHRMNFYTVTLDKMVEIKTIRNHARIYIREADVMLCDPRHTLQCFHPYSEEGIENNNYRGLIEEKRISGVFLELIDNENTVKTRYMYVAKKLIEIPARRDKEKESGLYCTLADFDKLSEVHLEPKHYTFDEAEDAVGLYKTREEALTGGNPEMISKTEEERSKRDLLDMKRLVDKEKIESEKIITRLNHELEMKKLENTKLKEAIDEKKLERTDTYDERKTVRADYYESRSAERKDSSDILKLSAAAVGGAIAVFGIMRARK